MPSTYVALTDDESDLVHNALSAFALLAVTTNAYEASRVQLALYLLPRFTYHNQPMKGN